MGTLLIVGGMCTWIIGNSVWMLWIQGRLDRLEARRRIEAASQESLD